jgi:hypothetical protein
MRGTHGIPALTTYRAEVEYLMSAGEPFGGVEDSINGIADLTEDEKAALWLFAFSLRSADEQQHDARAHLAAVQ